MSKRSARSPLPAAGEQAAPGRPKHRFFVPPEALSGDSVLLPSDVSHQVRAVLRLRAGARVIVLDGLGSEYVVELADLQAERAAGRIVERRPALAEPRAFVTLYAALLKGQHLEWVLQKGTELGVSAFVPMVTARTIVRDPARVRKKRDRWERILREAAEQCHRGVLPALSDPLSFDEACHAAASNHRAAFIPWVQEREIGLAEAVRALALGCERPRLALLIGPEGGFSEDEVQRALQAGITAVSLGPRTLRAETAALAASTIVLDELGDLGGAQGR